MKINQSHYFLHMYCYIDTITQGRWYFKNAGVGINGFLSKHALCVTLDPDYLHHYRPPRKHVQVQVELHCAQRMLCNGQIPIYQSISSCCLDTSQYLNNLHKCKCTSISRRSNFSNCCCILQITVAASCRQQICSSLDNGLIDTEYKELTLYVNI